ncbi:MAG TPA: MBL fold metallo-hydrolase [Chloroflexia bacterium]|nr:MBL fold metallo-hydrolase [Chloroflexia bacterium]
MANNRELILPAGRPVPDPGTGSIFFIGTATVLIRCAGFTILTDPNFLHRGEQVRLGYGLRSTRRTNPAISFQDLPRIDLVVLSHMHDDHFDRLVAQRLNRAVPIVTTGHAAAALHNMGFRAPQPLDTWETLTVVKGDARLRITAMPGMHGPGPLSALLPPVMGSMLDFYIGPAGPSDAPILRLYITGDTLIHERLRDIPARFPGIDLALLHLGGTRVARVLLTMDAAQGVDAIRIVRPRLAIPIHFNDYTVFKSPLRDFARAVAAAGLQQRVKYLKHGDTYHFPVRQPGATAPARAQPVDTTGSMWAAAPAAPDR